MPKKVSVRYLPWIKQWRVTCLCNYQEIFHTWDEAMAALPRILRSHNG